MNTSASSPPDAPQRSVGFAGALLIGLGAIVGGGIFVLAGVAFAAAGPAAAVAFALNGVVAALTAASFAELSTAFPESGGAYTFARRVLSVRAAFASGWVLWFAYIVAAVLYALGFGSYASVVLDELAAGTLGVDWNLGSSHASQVALALLAAGVYIASLTRKETGGGQAATVGKIIIFVLLVLGGLVAFVQEPAAAVQRAGAFAPHGAMGIVMAMGFTFIAVQGFDNIAAVAGEVRDPQKTIPRAMLTSLAVALAIYLPLMLLVSTVGVAEGVPIDVMSAASPETVVALAARRFMGTAGYWFVLVAAVLSTLSAMLASLLAASRVAARMATDRTIPDVLGKRDPRYGTPALAVQASGAAVIALCVVLPDLSAAGAAASLVFLLSFALSHLTSFLARRRGSASRGGWLAPMYPAVPIAGGLACAALAIFQAFAVPSAGGIVVLWMALGVVFYIGYFADRAEVVDAHAEAEDPTLVRMRGRQPLALVPVTNPDNARALVEVASALAPPIVGRVMLLSVVPVGDHGFDDAVQRSLASAQGSIREALTAGITLGAHPQALVATGREPWPEIARVAEAQQCEVLLLGYNELPDDAGRIRLEQLMSVVGCDVAVLRAPHGWRIDDVRDVLVPVGGFGVHDTLRARLLGSLIRGTQRRVRFVTVAPTTANEATLKAERKRIERLAREEAGGHASAEVLVSDDVISAIRDAAAESQLLVLGLQRLGRRDRVFGAMAVALAGDGEHATVMIGRGR